MSKREQNAPVQAIEDHRATKRIVVDLTETDVERLVRGLELIDRGRGRDVLEPIEREMQWRLDARRAAFSLDEIKDRGE
jgi:hypothetical protein